ncbi:MAG: hypothetical protein HOK97_16405, partial [Deltaproteobacteria bacterium]|nr:hypothetical protein [Deltaproteobacteria bacterium]
MPRESGYDVQNLAMFQGSRVPARIKLTEVTMTEQANDNQPSVLKWGLSVAASAGLTGMLCCVAPMVLFMFGVMGGAYAISFADFFYQAD